MLNGMERTLEKQLPGFDRRWPNSSVHEDAGTYVRCVSGFPEPRTLITLYLEPLFFLRLSRSGQGEDKGGSLAGFAFSPDPAAVEFDDSPGDG